MAGIGDIFGMMRNAGQIMEKAKAVQAELAAQTVEGVAGAGMVTAKLNGLGELLDLKLDKSIINPDEPEVLTDLIIAAVADAKRKTSELRTEMIEDAAGGFDLSSLGIDLGSLI